MEIADQRTAHTCLLPPASTEQLEQVLARHDIEVAAWGKGAAKRVDDLLAELRGGESRLHMDQEGRLFRCVAVIGVDVFFIDPHDPRQGMLRLVESEQIFKAGGRRRRRLRTSLGEKQLPGESAEAAAKRAIEEELGLPASKLILRKTGAEVVESESESYPGLTSTRHLTFFECALPLPLFDPSGYEERQDQKTITFAWKACA